MNYPQIAASAPLLATAEMRAVPRVVGAVVFGCCLQHCSGNHSHCSVRSRSAAAETQGKQVLVVSTTSLWQP